MTLSDRADGPTTMTRQIADSDRFGITVIVPVRNEASTLQAFLASLSVQTRQPDEVVICDGGSTDRSLVVLREWASTDPRFVVVEDTHAYPGRARNLAIERATRDWIALTDAGTLVPPTWLGELVARRDGVDQPDVVYGSYEPIMERFVAQCAALAFLPPTRPVEGGRARGPTTASMLVAKRVWRDAGGFPEHLRAAEDLLFFERIATGGARVAWAPRAIVQWRIPDTVPRLFRRFRQFSRYTLAAGLGHQWHTRVGLMYLGAAVLAALAVFQHPAWWLVICAATVARAVSGIRRRKPPAGPAVHAGAVHLAGVIGLLLMIDLAALLGALDYMWAGRTSP